MKTRIPVAVCLVRRVIRFTITRLGIRQKSTNP